MAAHRAALDAGADAVISRVLEMQDAGEKVERSFSFNRAAIDKEARTVEVAFSSEEPYLRWFGNEILGHKEGEIRLDRMNDGAAVLVGHNWWDARDHVGVVDSVRIEGKVGRAVLRFSTAERASEVFNDIEAGIRRHISVGYIVHKMQLIEENNDGEPDTYRVTDWEPYEVSIVPVPADPTVGVGKSLLSRTPDDTRTTTDEVITVEDDKVDQAAVEKEKQRLKDEAEKREAAEKERVSEILAVGEAQNCMKMATEFVNSGRSAEEFYKAILEKRGVSAEPAPSDPNLGLSEREAQRFRINRLILAMAFPTERRLVEAAAFELEVSEETKKLHRKDGNGHSIPHDILSRKLARAPGDTDMNVGVDADGGFTVETEHLSFIERLENRMALRQLGITILPGLSGDLAIPRQNGGAAAYWVDENGAPSSSGAVFDQLAMTPKHVAAFTELSRKFLLQTSLAAEAFTLDELALRIALAIDADGINAPGTGNRMLGILNQVGIGAVVGGTGFAWDESVDLETEVADDNADIGNLAYLTNARVRGLAKKTRIEAGTTDMVWDRRSPETPVNGYPCVVSNQVPKTLGGGSDSAMIFGNWRDIVLGFWGTLDLMVNPYALDTTGGIRVTGHQNCDMIVRHPESFAAKTNIAA